MVPAPATNLKHALDHTIAATGDYAGGTEPSCFTKPNHGLTTGARLWLIWESAAGVVGGEVQEVYTVLKVNNNVFQLTDSAGDLIENSADGEALFGDVSKP